MAMVRPLWRRACTVRRPIGLDDGDMILIATAKCLCSRRMQSSRRGDGTYLVASDCVHGTGICSGVRSSVMKVCEDGKMIQ